MRAVFLKNAVHRGFELFALGAVDDVGILDADQRFVRGDDDDIEAVNFSEFLGFGFRGSGHAGEFFVHAEVILESDGGERLIFALDFHGFLGFDGLVQTVGPAAAGHLAARELVHDDDFTFLDDVVHVALEERVRAQALIDVMNRLEVLRVVHIRQAEQALALGDAFLRQRGGFVFFIERVINVADELGNDFVDAIVLVGGFFGGAGNDQGSAGLVDQDGVHFVDDAEVVAALDAIGKVVLHVVAKIIEAEFVVRAVGDVGSIGGAALRVVEIVDDDADGEAECFVNRAHPFGVAAGEIIVDGDDMNAAAGERVEIRGKRGDERLAFAGLHFGNFAFVQDHAADELDVEMAHAEFAAASFANEGEGRDEYGLERVLEPHAIIGVLEVGAFEFGGDLGLQLGSLDAEIFVGEPLHFGLEGVDGGDERLELFDVALVLRPDEDGYKIVD